MKRTIGLLAALSLTLGLAVIGSGPAGAQTATPVVPIIQQIELPLGLPPDLSLLYAIHGLNLDGQDSQDDGGTAVTVCAGGIELLDDFQFGDISEATPVTSGVTVPIDVFAGAGTPCDTTDDPLISQDVTVPSVEGAVAVVATAGPAGDPELLPFVLNTSAVDCGVLDVAPAQVPSGVLGAAHAAAAGPVSLVVDGTPVPGELPYGGLIADDAAADTYSVAVLLDGTTILGPVDVEVEPCVLTQVYVVGNQPLPEPPPIDPPAPTVPTTAAPTTTAAAGPAGATAATPRFAG